MKTLQVLIGGMAMLASMQSMAQDGVFIACNANTSDCPVKTENSILLQMIQTSISAYQQAATNGTVPPLAVGDGVQAQSLLTTKAGYVEYDHFFTISSLPVGSWSDLIDNGLERDTDGSVHYVPSGGRADWLGGFNITSSTFDAWAVELPWPGCTTYPC
jgi:hypothetical protein